MTDHGGKLAGSAALAQAARVGPGMMHTAVANWAGADITDRMKTFYAAHNEYLELLLTTGVVGLAAWLWFVAAHLRRAAQNWLRPGVAPVTLALVSYLPTRSSRSAFR